MCVTVEELLKSLQEPDSQAVCYSKIYEDGAQNGEKTQILLCIKVSIVKNVKSNKHASETKQPPKKGYISDSGMTHR